MLNLPECKYEFISNYDFGNVYDISINGITDKAN